MEVFTRAGDGGWRLQVVDGLQADVVDGLQADLDLSALAVRVPTAELYDLVDLDSEG